MRWLLYRISSSMAGSFKRGWGSKLIRFLYFNFIWNSWDKACSHEYVVGNDINTSVLWMPVQGSLILSHMQPKVWEVVLNTTWSQRAPTRLVSSLAVKSLYFYICIKLIPNPLFIGIRKWKIIPKRFLIPWDRSSSDVVRKSLGVGNDSDTLFEDVQTTYLFHHHSFHFNFNFKKRYNSPLCRNM